MYNCIRDIEPSTSTIQPNVYHMHTPLFVLDCVRVFQDHPKFCRGLKEHHIIGMLDKEPFANGDTESQVKTAIKELTACGFLRFINQGYRTLGPFSRLALARTPRQFTAAWERLTEMQNISNTSLCSSTSMRSQTC